MKLSVWAERQGIRYKTAWRMWKAGTLPVPCEQLPTGTVVVHAEAKSHGVARYARVSSADQKDDLDRQLVRLTHYAIANKLVIAAAVKEVGSGLNGHRKNVLRLLKNPQIEPDEMKDDIVRVKTEVLTSMCARLYGKRSARNRARKALDALQGEHEVLP